MIAFTIPVYNEAGIIASSIKDLLGYLDSHFEDFNVIVADDASRDNTGRIALDLSKSLRFKVHSSKSRLGRGKTIRTLWSNIDADIYVYMDADLASDLSYVPTLVSAIENGADVATGSRYLKSSVTNRPTLRLAASRFYNALVRTTFNEEISDHQCGFKAFSRRAIRTLLPLTRDDHWFWDTEVLVLASRLGLTVREIPIVWTEPRGIHTPLGRLISDSVHHGLGLIRLTARVNTLNGVNNQPREK